MNSKLLIDAIVQQTTVLIAQLSTAAGIRAPLAHVADQVFVTLAKEIEAQGVGRKVVADMFGIALRTYQKKVQRLTESATVRDRTLWEAVLDFVTEHGSVTRSRLLQRFAGDGERAVIGVIGDLVNSGLVYSAGRGAALVYRATSEADRRTLSEEEGRGALEAMVWARVYREPGVTPASLAVSLAVDAEMLGATIAELRRDGRIVQDDEPDGALRSATFRVPLGSEVGWEGAVYDHFQAMANAIAAKVRGGSTQAKGGDVIGGATLSFDLHPEHPHRERVLGLLARVRRDVNDLWDEVTAENAKNPVPASARTKVTFYFGQNVEDHASLDGDGGGPS